MCAGSVIHATGEQDIRRMGVYLSFTYNLYYNALASLSLIGFLSLVVSIERFIIRRHLCTFPSVGYVIYLVSVYLHLLVLLFLSINLLVFFGDVVYLKKLYYMF